MFEVIQARGQIEDGKVSYYQAVLKLGFTSRTRDPMPKAYLAGAPRCPRPIGAV